MLMRRLTTLLPLLPLLLSASLAWGDTVVTPKPVTVPDLPTMAVEFATRLGLTDTGTCTKAPLPAGYVQCQAEDLPEPPLPTQNVQGSGSVVLPWIRLIYRVACQTDIGCWLLGPGEPATGGR
jgi:hypothetical protein